MPRFFFTTEVEIVYNVTRNLRRHSLAQPNLICVVRQGGKMSGRGQKKAFLEDSIGGRLSITLCAGCASRLHPFLSGYGFIRKGVEK